MYTRYLLISLIQIKSVFLQQFHSPNAFTLYNLESTCGDGGKQSLHLNNPGVFVFNSTVNSSKFSCHLELHLHSKALGFSVFLESLSLASFMNSDCSRDYLQFGRDRLFITTHLSDKYCEQVEHTEEVRDPETGALLHYDFKGMPYERREYVETRDNEMDVWINLERSRSPQDLKQIKLVVVPFRKSCNLEDEKYYRRCPGTGRCFKKEYYCSGMVKCEVLSDLQLRGSCLKDSEGSDFLYLPIIIIATVGIIVATVSIGFAVKLMIKHFTTDNGVHNIESSQSTSRTCSPHIIPSSASPGTALLTPEREQRRPDIQEVPLSAVTIKHSAPPSYDEVFGHISKDEPPQYQDVVHEDSQDTSSDILQT